MMNPTAVSSQMQTQKKKTTPSSSPYSIFGVCIHKCVSVYIYIKLYGEFSIIE